MDIDDCYMNIEDWFDHDIQAVRESDEGAESFGFEDLFGEETDDDMAEAKKMQVEA